MARTHLRHNIATFDAAAGDVNEVAHWANADGVPADVTIRLHHGLNGNWPADIRVAFESTTQWPLAGFLVTNVDANNVDIKAQDCPPGGIDALVRIERLPMEGV